MPPLMAKLMERYRIFRNDGADDCVSAALRELVLELVYLLETLPDEEPCRDREHDGPVTSPVQGFAKELEKKVERGSPHSLDVDSGRIGPRFIISFVIKRNQLDIKGTVISLISFPSQL
jgi:hypothetical protein